MSHFFFCHPSHQVHKSTRVVRKAASFSFLLTQPEVRLRFCVSLCNTAMPYKLLSLLSARNVDLERFALASTVEERRAFVDERFTAGTADHFLLSVLCDQQAGVPRQQRKALRLNPCAPGGRNERRPNMALASACWTGERAAGLARGPERCQSKDHLKTATQRSRLRRELDLSFSHAPPKAEAVAESKSAASQFAVPAEDWWWKNLSRLLITTVGITICLWTTGSISRLTRCQLVAAISDSPVNEHGITWS